MNDTSQEILQKQFEIIYSKPLREKIDRLFEMTDLSRQLIMGRIKSANPGISETELKIQLFRKFYHFDFDENTLNEISHQMRDFLEPVKQV